MSKNRCAQKLEMSKTGMSAFFTADEHDFRQMCNSNYCDRLQPFHFEINLLETEKWRVKIQNESQKLVEAKWGVFYFLYTLGKLA